MKVTLLDVFKLASFAGAIFYLVKTLEPKPWLNADRWKEWLWNTALLFVIAAALSMLVPNFPVYEINHGRYHYLFGQRL